MPEQDMIIIDRLPHYQRVGLIRDGQLDQIFIDNDRDTSPQPGAVLAVRVAQIFQNHDRVTLDLGSNLGPDQTASMRIKKGITFQSGQMIAVEVIASPREGKPLQVRLKGDISHKDLPQHPALLKPAPDSLARAQALMPAGKVINDDDGQAWDHLLCDDAIEQACQKKLVIDHQVPMAAGSVVHIHTPPGASVIDIDSGNSKLPPFELTKSLIPFVMRQLRLRRIGGPIVIDFPRLDKTQQTAVHNMIKTEAHYDCEKPSLHGFTRGGLYTMSRPWRGSSLVDLFKPDAALMGRAALRLIRRHKALQIPGGIVIGLNSDALAWINDDEQSGYQHLIADLAFSPEFHSDNDMTIPGVIEKS